MELEKSRVIVAASVSSAFSETIMIISCLTAIASGGHFQLVIISSRLCANRYKNWQTDDMAYRELFFRFEYLLALVHADIPENTFNHGHGPIGEFAARAWRGGHPYAVQELNSELAEYKDKHPLLTAGLFGGSLERLIEIRKGVDEQISKSGH